MDNMIFTSEVCGVVLIAPFDKISRPPCSTIRFIVFLSLFFRCFSPFSLYHRTFSLTTEYHTERIYPVGHRTDPISDQALEEKFLRCTRPVLGEEQARVLCRTLWKLKDDAVTNLMRQTVPILR